MATRPITEWEHKNQRLPKSLGLVVDKYHERIDANPKGQLCVDKDSGFCTPTGLAWDILLKRGWSTNDGGHRVIIESNSGDAATLIREAIPCDCLDCK